MLAVLYGQYSTACPVRGWGGGEQMRNVYDPDTGLWYSAGTERREDGTHGAQITARRDGPMGPVAFHRWFPWESFRKVRVTLDCSE